MQRKLLMATFAGGLVYFLWTNISWMLSGWHNSYMSPVPNEEALAQAIRTEVPKDGLYFIPHHDGSDYEAAMKKMEAGPFAYMMIFPQGKSGGMTQSMLGSVLINLFMVFLASFLLLQTSGLSFLKRVIFVEATGLAGGVWTVFSNWNWWGFPGRYLAVNLVDIFVAWLLVGLVLAKVTMMGETKSAAKD